MASYNRVMLIGNLTRDIELRYTAGGLAVSDMGLAVNDRRKNRDGQWVDDVCFVSVTLFGRTAEVASEYLSKGSPVFIEGHLKFDSWEKDGQKKSKLSVVCDRMQMLGSGGQRDGGASNRGGENASNRGSSSQPSATAGPNHDHDGGGRSGQSGPADRGEAAPTGDGSGYDEADIPF